MIPLEVLFTVELGGAKFGWLPRLKNSARNCTLTFSRMAKLFIRPMSTLISPGPSRMPLPAFPNCPRGATAKAFPLNQFVGVRVPGPNGSAPEMTFGRCPPAPDNALSPAITGVNGKPDCKAKIPDTCHPPAMALTRGSAVFRKGNSLPPPNTKRCRLSEVLRPRLQEKQ